MNTIIQSLSFLVQKIISQAYAFLSKKNWQAVMVHIIQSGISFAHNYLAPVRLGYQVAESGAVTLQNSSPQRFEQLHKIQKIFIAATGFMALIDYTQLFFLLDHKWSILLAFDDFIGIPIILSAAAIFFTAFGIVRLCYRYFRPTTDPNIHLPIRASGIEVSWQRPEIQQFNHALLGSRVILNVALACFAASPYFYLASAALQVYSLSKSVSWNWIRYDRTFIHPNDVRLQGNGGDIPAIFPPFHERLRSLMISYFRPMLPALGHKNDTCSMCQEDEPTTQFCNQHAAHESCIIGSVYGEMERFRNLNMWRHIQLGANPIRYDRDGRGTHVEYSFRASNEIFPRCPDCRNQPGVGHIEFWTKDEEFPDCQTKANVVFR